MPRPPHTPWPTGPRTVFFDDVASRPTIQAATAARRIRRIATHVYSADLVAPVADIVGANLWAIVGRLCPDAVIVDRSAARGGRAGSALATIAADRVADIVLPGVRVSPRPLARSATDMPWTSGLFLASPARTIVDNLTLSRSRAGRTPRTLSRAELTDWLAGKAVMWDPARMARLRGEAHLVCDDLYPDDDGRHADIDRTFDEVSGLARPVRGAAFARAVADGGGWDERRIRMFERAAVMLTKAYADGDLGLAVLPGEPGRLAAAFHEAYFSNYIEGTIFDLEEARRIVDTGVLPSERPADGHDILGTYRCIADPVGSRVASGDASDPVEVLIARHAAILGGRPDMRPGELKQAANRVGDYTFVEPRLVAGTLARGLALVPSVPAGFARAVLALLVVAEVHPFVDGNGRAARLTANAELAAVGASRVIIPTVSRNEYLDGHRRASRGNGDVSVLVQVLEHAWRWSAAMPWDDPIATAGQLEATNALRDSTEAAGEGIRLELP